MPSTASRPRIVSFAKPQKATCSEVTVIRRTSSVGVDGESRLTALALRCSICLHPVQVEMAKTDELGEAIHELCYVLKLKVSLPRGDSSEPINIPG